MLARGVSLDRYDVERYRVSGMEVLPCRGVKYAVQLTRGHYLRPAHEDYEYWAERWGIAAAELS